MARLYKELVFVVEDEAELRSLLAEMLKREGHSVKTFATGAAALKEYLRLATVGKPPGLVLLDLWLESEDKGLEILGEMLRQNPNVPIIIISGHASIDSAVRAVKLGAYDFIEKPFSGDSLLIAINRALETSSLRRNLARLEAHRSYELALEGKSAVIKKLRADLGKMAATNARILILGKPGSGRRAAAEYIHSLARGPKPGPPKKGSSDKKAAKPAAFFSVGCRGLDEAEFDSIFAESGVIASAGDCTVYLEEISALPKDLQQRLLAAVRGGEGRRVRFISSSAKDLKAKADNGDFLPELYYRLAVFTVVLPALAERSEDIPLLAAKLMRDGGKFSRAAIASLQAYNWPGNLWELRNVIDRLRAMMAENDDSIITLQMLPDEITKPAAGLHGIEEIDENIAALPLRRAREAFEAVYLKAQLNRCGGNVRKVAEISGLERTALYTKLKRLGLRVGKQ